MLLHLRNKISLSNCHFLLSDVAGDVNVLHSIQQWTRNSVEGVGGAEEKDMRKVNRNVQIVVKEGRVLLRVQHLQQGSCGVALPASPHLVNLIDQDQRVLSLCLLECLHCLARHCSNIRSPMSFQFCHIRKATHRESEELPVQGSGDAGLANARRSRETDYFTLCSSFELAHCYELKNPFLDIIETIVVVIQHLSSSVQGKIFFTGEPPWKAGQPVQVVSCHTELARVRVQKPQLVDFLVNNFFGDLWHRQRFQPFLVLFDDGLCIIFLHSQLLLYHLQLLHKHVLPLHRLYLLLHVFANLLLQLAQLIFLLQQLQAQHQSGWNVLFLDNLHQLFSLPTSECSAKIAEVDWVVNNPLSKLQHLLQ